LLGCPPSPGTLHSQALDRHERKKNLAMVAQVRPKLEPCVQARKAFLEVRITEVLREARGRPSP
jgi:hypothetical protein